MTLSKRTIEVSKAQAAVGAGLLHRRAFLTGSMAIAGALCAGVRPEAAPVSAAPDSAPLSKPTPVKGGWTPPSTTAATSSRTCSSTPRRIGVIYGGSLGIGDWAHTQEWRAFCFFHFVHFATIV